MPRETRITVRELAPIARTLYRDNRYHGEDLGRALRVPGNTIYAYFHRNGIMPEDAIKIADRIGDWQEELENLAVVLRELATERPAARPTRIRENLYRIPSTPPSPPRRSRSRSPRLPWP